MWIFSDAEAKSSVRKLQLITMTRLQLTSHRINTVSILPRDLICSSHTEPCVTETLSYIEFYLFLHEGNYKHFLNYLFILEFRCSFITRLHVINRYCWTVVIFQHFFFRQKVLTSQHFSNCQQILVRDQNPNKSLRDNVPLCHKQHHCFPTMFCWTTWVLSLAAAEVPDKARSWNTVHQSIFFCKLQIKRQDIYLGLQVCST